MSEQNNDQSASSILQNLTNISLSDESVDEINKLVDALETAQNTLTISPTLQVEDVMDAAEKYLSPKALEDLSRKSGTLTALDDKGNVIAKAIYLGTRVKSNNIEKGVEKISSIINDMSDDGLIHSCLGSMISLDLARIPKEASTSAVICYVLIPVDRELEFNVKYNENSFKEGQVPKPIEDLRPDLEDGEFLAEVRISYMSSMLTTFTVKDAIQDEINQYLAVLPKGTEVRAITECAVMDLSKSYEVKFYNPLLKNIKSVETEYVRTAEYSGPGKIQQFNLLTGVKYFDANGKQLFKN